MLAGGRELDWPFDPVQVLQRWPIERTLLMLHSGRFQRRWARWSVLAEPAAWYRFTETGPRSGQSEWVDATPPVHTTTAFTHRPLTDLRQLLAGSDGVWIGYLSYDLARWIEHLPEQAVRDRPWPVVMLGWCPGALIHDAATGRWRAWGDYARPELAPHLAEPRDEPVFQASALHSVFARAEYEQAVQRVRQYIAAGDVFQVNLAQRFTASVRSADRLATRSLYRQLASVSPAWYAAYLELPDELTIASISPELFLSLDGAGSVITRPIKGTRPASVSARELLESEKDTAELTMIVDLLRNDIGRVCDYGSVHVAEPRVIESHPTVHHGVATVVGALHRDKDAVDLLRATLPGGSITGAPKIRAMQIIDELEPVRRGPYCGCIGLLSKERVMLNIAIRTLLLDGRARRADFSVGGGIVADSDPADEYEETLVKAQAMLQAMGLAVPAASVR